MKTRCDQCKKDIVDLVDINGFPLYYFGSGPNNPEDADVYFCGPDCSNEYHRTVVPSSNGKASA